MRLPLLRCRRLDRRHSGLGTVDGRHSGLTWWFLGTLIHHAELQPDALTIAIFLVEAAMILTTNLAALMLATNVPQVSSPRIVGAHSRAVFLSSVAAATHEELAPAWNVGAHGVACRKHRRDGATVARGVDASPESRVGKSSTDPCACEVRC
jgi:hypothetical protein